MKPVIMIILDGAADLTECLEYKESPLEVATTPGLDKLARNGHAGLLYPIEKDIEPETHTGMLNLLGYAIMPDEAPRGPIEALGCGLKFETGNLVLRINFGTRDEATGFISDRRTDRSLSMEEASILCRDIVEQFQELDLGYKFDMRAVREYRACIVIQSQGMPLSDNISNTDPVYPTENKRVNGDGGYKPIVCYPLDDTDAARRTAVLVNDFVRQAEEVLRKHPINCNRLKKGKPLANAILTRGPGCSLPSLIPLSDRFGLRFTLLADMPIELGVGILVGCKCYEYVSSENLRETYNTIVDEIKKLAVPGTVTIAHIKGPDEYGHDNNFSGKVDSIEQIDQWLIAPLTHIMLDNSIIVVTSDHATPCFYHTHSSDPVVFVVAGQGAPINGASRITERACSTLQSPIYKGSQLLSFALKLATK